MTAKFSAVGLRTAAAAAVIAGASVGAVTALTSPFASPVGSPAVQLAVMGAPLPADPAAVMPSADQLSGVLNSLADPGVPFASKGYLVEGGLGRLEARTADALMRKAIAKGQVPLNFVIGNILPAGAGAATANVTATGPGMPAVTQNLLFVDQGGWKLSRSSATAVLGMFQAA